MNDNCKSIFAIIHIERDYYHIFPWTPKKTPHQTPCHVTVDMGHIQNVYLEVNILTANNQS